MHENRHFLYWTEICLQIIVSSRARTMEKYCTMYNYDPSMPQLFLVDSLCIDKVLAKKGPHRCRLIEADDTIVCTNLLERT